MKTNVLMIAMASAMLATSVTTNSTAKTVSETATTRQQTDSTTFKGCCGMCKNRTENAGDMNKMMEHADEMHKEAAPMMKAYLNISSALIADDPAAAQKAAKDMMDLPEVNGQLKSNLSEIAETADLKEQRKHFSALSAQLYEMAKTGEITGTSLYLKHCTMAMNGERAYGLRMSGKISNPYMGQKMPGCGSVKETLNN